ncbi:MlaA family lipoprotein [Thermodesulforhabdus norvegica]|uniref:Phospholipid-binding lipoprotein MlaA n=1 Tax=Thermodesulforhabdus norvegica TaxID=39841 RepID=A0A1I4VGB2_9BACT|nr:VacJ family lipoprotein [Thermodesulforhabdus norvegica]SFN00156.1 phospholipid-binding lipoprotein MlaA [Thermodesulforhabdus norvegica]
MAQRQKIMVWVLLFLSTLLLIGLPIKYAASETIGRAQTALEPAEYQEPIVADPLEPINRFFFEFNDKMYFWLVKPVCTVYKTFLPPGLRQAIKNAFENLRAPIRFVNCILQRKGQAASTELKRFVVNSTLGLGGFFDIAKTHFNIEAADEDFGQTLGVYEVSEGIYINWPFLGPSTVRDSVGLVVDFFLDPLTYMPVDYLIQGGIRAGSHTNNTSLRLGEYEDLKESAIDPYVALKDAYIQHRRELIRR